MSFDFETPIDRRGSGAIKFDRRPELDPFWVADMDFASAPAIIEALQQRVAHGIFGYTNAHPGLIDAIIGYGQQRHQTAIAPAHIVHLGGLVCALSMVVRAFCKPGDAVMTCTPVYPPFLSVHHDSEAKLITVDHTRDELGRWTFDWEAMENAVTPHTKVFILCHPQNPLGRVFSQPEILRLAEFCEKHDLILLSDEVHCDLVLEEDQTPFFSSLRLAERFQDRVVTLLSPSKTWNVAGLGYAFAVIPSDSVRRKVTATRGHTQPEINPFGFIAAEASYRDGEAWRQELIPYLRDNRDALVDFITTRIPQLKVDAGEATYLAWIDARGLGVDNPANFFEKQAGLYLSDGAFFGWPGYVRFNFGCPRARMLSGLEKMAAAVETLAAR